MEAWRSSALCTIHMHIYIYNVYTRTYTRRMSPAQALATGPHALPLAAAAAHGGAADAHAHARARVGGPGAADTARPSASPAAAGSPYARSVWSGGRGAGAGDQGYERVQMALEEFVRQLVGCGGGVGALLWLVGAGHYAGALEREEMRSVRAVAQASEAQLQAAGVRARGARVRIMDAARGVRALMDGLGQAM
jgi:hypothetical protein